MTIGTRASRAARIASKVAQFREWTTCGRSRRRRYTSRRKVRGSWPDALPSAWTSTSAPKREANAPATGMHTTVWRMPAGDERLDDAPDPITGNAEWAGAGSLARAGFNAYFPAPARDLTAEGMAATWSIRMWHSRGTRVSRHTSMLVRSTVVRMSSGRE